MTLSEWKADGQYFDYKSQQIFTRDRGNGQNLLLIHGFPTASWDWYKMWDKLESGFRLLTLDMLGFGFSGKPRNYSYSILDQADLIEQFLEIKQVKQVHILSHDYGDTVAQELLARQIERARGLKNRIYMSAKWRSVSRSSSTAFGSKIIDESGGEFSGTVFQSKEIGTKL